MWNRRPASVDRPAVRVSAVAAALCSGALAAPVSVRGAAVDFTIDTSRSSSVVGTTLGQYSSNLSVPIAGTLRVDSDAAGTWLSVDGLSIQMAPAASGNFQQPVGVPPFGSVLVDYTGLVLGPVGATPGEQLSVDALGAWAMPSCPLSAAGHGWYATSGLVCGQLTVGGIACQLNADLGPGGPRIASISNGRLVQNSGGRELSGRLVVTFPLNPSLGISGGSWTVTANFVATAAGCRADFDGNGSRSVNDLFEFLAAWFATNGQSGAGLAADMNADQTISVGDLFEFLALWFAGC